MAMTISNKILSNIVTYMKYAKFVPHKKRRESWFEIVTRNKEMHKVKYPMLAQEIEDTYQFVYDRKILPSMRSMQFAGKPVLINPARIYNCFSSDTAFVTSDGVKSFQEFSDGDEISVLTHLGNWKPAVVKNYGKDSLNEITFRRGRSVKKIKATSNHRWILHDWSETTSLKIGDKLCKAPSLKHFDYDSASPFERLYWCYGYVFGDGTNVKNSNGETAYSMVRLCGNDKNKFLYRFEEMGFKTSTSLSLSGDVMAYTGKYTKKYPDPSVDSIELIHAFVDGYCCADAYKNSEYDSSTNSSKYKSIYISDLYHQEVAEKLFEMVGQYVINKKPITNLSSNLGSNVKRNPNSKSYSLSSNIGNYINTSWVVTDIKYDVEKSDVWCLEVEDDKSFILSGGLVTGNCAFMPADSWEAFPETMFLLLTGCGVGFSVQKHHVKKLPEIKKPGKAKRYLVGDSIEGWADAVKVLVKAYMFGEFLPRFDFSDIRPKGSLLITSGGKAPGPQPLMDCLHDLKKILDSVPVGEKLKPIQVHDMQCFIADAVLSGGIRRAALISLFSYDDDDMLASKFNHWWELNPQRARANNSVVMLRHKVKKEDFFELWKKIENSNSGEPGILFSNDKEYGVNPCCEISLRANQFCNLVEVNAGDIEDEADFSSRVKAATFLATLQAGFTDFHYLREIWKETTEKEALIGVGITGIGSGKLDDVNLKNAAKIVTDENKRVAKIIGINTAARSTTIKPSGTSSIVLGTASGVHAYHAPYYIRRVRVGKNEAIYKFLAKKHPELVEDDYFKPHIQAIISVPQESPKGAKYRDESPLTLLERAKRFNIDWVRCGHVKGANTNNVSVTVSIKKDEWDKVGEWMWENKDFYNGISVLDYDGGSYVQAPFEEITKEKYDEMMKVLKDVDLTKIVEEEDNTDLQGEAACAGDACAVI